MPDVKPYLAIYVNPSFGGEAEQFSDFQVQTVREYMVGGG